MSGYPDTTVRSVQSSVESGDMALQDPQMVESGPERDEHGEVALWKSWIKRRQNADDFAQWKKSCDEAKKFYKGDLDDDMEAAALGRIAESLGRVEEMAQRLADGLR